MVLENVLLTSELHVPVPLYTLLELRSKEASLLRRFQTDISVLICVLISVLIIQGTSCREISFILVG